MTPRSKKEWESELNVVVPKGYKLGLLSQCLAYPANSKSLNTRSNDFTNNS